MNQDLNNFLAMRQEKKQSLTLVTGVFDLLHDEHVAFLKKAKKTADLLLVGLESDKRVKQMKGEDRPINNAGTRVKNLEQLNLADFVFVLPEEFSRPEHHRALIAQIKPNFMAVSSNTAFQEKKAKILAEFGAKLLVVHDYNPAISSSKLVEQLRKKGL